MEARMFGFLAETSVHPGSGQDAGLIDSPVAREATTDYPVVFGSALKGALRDTIYWRKYEQQLKALPQQKDQISEQEKKAVDKHSSNHADKYFGKPDQAGPILVSDLRLLLLPVRSLSSCYYWVTCPYLIERCCRDEVRARRTAVKFDFSQLADGLYLASSSATPKTIYLEERQYQYADELPEGLVDFLSKYIPHASAQARLPSQCVVLSDNDFAWFARYGLAVAARNALDRDKKTSRNLWYEETIPPDSLFHCLLAGRSADILSLMATELQEASYIQVGGNETVGQGWFAISPIGGL